MPCPEPLGPQSVVHVHDLRTQASYIERNPLTVAAVELGGTRTILAVPMLKEGELIGAFGRRLSRQEVCPFTDKQIELVQNFAAQAVIAIENARLLNELRQRTAHLTELLEQQTATSEVLRVISNSPSELDPVFQTMLANATRLCEAHFGILHQFDGTTFHIQAAQGLTPAYADLLQRTPQTPDRRNTLGRLLETREPIHVADLTLERAYLEREPIRVAVVEMGGARTLLAVPMLKETEVVGSIVIFRKEVRPFTDKQIELVKNFASQAVIALPEFEEFLRTHPVVPRHDTVLGRAVMERRATHVHDIQNDLQYKFAAQAAKVGGFRTMLGVPLLREGIPIGVIMLTRKLARPFTEKRSIAGGELHARSRNRALHHRRQGGAARRHLFSSNGRTSVRRTRMVPSARPSRINGTARALRCPNLIVNSRASANSSPAFCRSATWIDCLSQIDVGTPKTDPAVRQAAAQRLNWQRCR